MKISKNSLVLAAAFAGMEIVSGCMVCLAETLGGCLGHIGFRARHLKPLS